MKVKFIGHSTLLIETKEARLITDPHFSSRMLWSARISPPCVDLDEVKDVDGILLSHGHLDHLDPRTLRRFGEKSLLAVPPGLGWLGRRCVNGRCAVLKPWEQLRIGDAIITATPVNHVNFRPGFIFGRATGYTVEACGSTVFFAGDTSYFDGIKNIGARCKIEVAFLPIGPIKPAWFQRKFHMDPSQAIRAFKELSADYIVPIHWGGFRSIFDGDCEAVNSFKELVASEGLSNQAIILQPGESIVL